VSIGGTGARYAALTAKGIAGTMLTQPQDFQALRLGYKRLGMSTEVVKEIAWSSYSTSRDFAAKNEEVLVRFLGVQRKANLWLNDTKNRSEAIAILVKYAKTEQSDSEQTYDLWLENRAFTPDSTESPVAVKQMIDMMVLTNQLKAPIAVEKVLDQSYMDKAKARG
jgi:ABC-type nitrate/sulfonate/bicarbonate transport system substrate-binding protein